MNIRTGQCTPLVFHNVKNDPTATALRYTQHFTTLDHIVVQMVCDEVVAVYLRLMDAASDTMLSMNWMDRIDMHDGRYIYHCALPVLNEGLYYVLVTLPNASDWMRSADFQVLADPVADSVLFEYTNFGDSPLDNAFIVSGVRQVFRFRIEGGFKPQGYTPNVSQETWRTQRQELRLLYSAPFDKWTLTVGTAQGVPVEYVRLLNNILSCDAVYINGKRWCRSDGATPEKTLTMQGAQMFTASVDLERQPSLDDYPLELYWNYNEFNDDYNNDYDI